MVVRVASAVSLLVLGACQGADTGLVAGTDPTTETETETETTETDDTESGSDTMPSTGVESGDTQGGADGWVMPPAGDLRVAFLGDYGEAGESVALVAGIIDSWAPDMIATAGDNNYPIGSADTMDENVGQYFAKYIMPYKGAYGPGSKDVNRFFPSLGNHDWDTPDLQPHFDYFTLPGNERYYDVDWSPVHLFVVDSDPREPHGNTMYSVQERWLKAAVAESTAPFKLVTLHHAPYSSGLHGESPDVQWAYRDYGITAHIAGHDHTYERIVRDGLPFVIAGFGGKSLYSIYDLIEGSQVQFDDTYGTVIADFTDDYATFRSLTIDGIQLDEFTMTPEGLGRNTDLVRGSSKWRYVVGLPESDEWAEPDFDDERWGEGLSDFGFGDGFESTVLAANTTLLTLRQSFEIEDPATITRLTLGLVRDDGAVVYLNGQEVHRVNLPEGPITEGTRATQSVEGDDESTYFEVEIAPWSLQAGTNVLGVQVVQVAGGPGDMSFAARLIADRATPVITRGDVWSYRDDGVAPASGWTEAGFGESRWSTGPSPLGYGTDVKTEVGFGDDEDDRHITTWFRREFTLAAPSDMLLRLKRDDGAVVYVNGAEVLRVNMPMQAIDAQTEAGYDFTSEIQFIETVIEQRFLVAGVNAVAVEIHQASGVSSDLLFDAELYLLGG